MSDDPPSSDRDEQLFELLNGYVNALTGTNGEIPDPPQELIEAFPELSEMLDCLDTLDELALPGAASNPSNERKPYADETFAPPSTPGIDRDLNTDQSPAAPSPCDFGRYELIREIGRGGMGIVYLARQKQLNATIALKLVGRSRFASVDEIRRFYTEARAAAGLRHPNIVCVHDVGEWQGEHFLSMDYVKGASLAEHLQNGPLTPREAAGLLLIVTKAVAYLHQQKIIHRDLKPSNIMLDADGEPHVTDFGLAKVFDGDSRETASGTIIGTPAYMAPEQASGRTSEVSQLSDVYSLGAILYEMLTGQPPFAEENPLDTLLQVIESTPDPLRRHNPNIPPELEAVCLHCLEKDPSDRFDSADALATQLDNYLKGELVELPARSLWDRTVRWAKREPALASRMGVLVVASLIVQTYYQMGGHDDLRQHFEVMSVMGIWIVLSFACQLMQSKESWEMTARYLWWLSDAVCYTAVLCLADGPLGPVVVGYPVLIAGSGLWARERLVWFMTAVTTISYIALGWVRNDGWRVADPQSFWHYPIIFGISLIATGVIVAFQVRRLRMLSRYFERRRV